MLRRMADLPSELLKIDLNSQSTAVPKELPKVRSAPDFAHPEGKEGRRNQSLTKPVTINDSTGEVLVRKSTGKTKVRKGQTHEEYEEQLRQYFVEEQGPTKTEVSWMEDSLIDENALNSSQLELKQVRQKLVSHAHRYYYRGRYLECLQLSEQLLERFEPYNKKNKLLRELDELKYMVKKSRSKMASVSPDA